MPMKSPLPRELLVLALLLLPACAPTGTPGAKGGDHNVTAVDPQRDTDAARRHNDRAAELIGQDNLGEAEKELKAALAADMFFGPAHSNLGTVFFRQKKFYQACQEYQYAAEMMPKKAEPRGNLGLVLEAVGRFEEAAKAYEDALTCDPDAIVIEGNLARAYVRLGRKDDRTRKLLNEVVMKDSRPEWISWAKDRLALMARPTTTSTSAPAE
jgi:Flp pilus assembly protein TadD